MKREEVFERLEPPSGGLSGLRERMAEPPWTRRFVLVAAAIAAVLVLLWSSGRAPDLVTAARQRGGLDEIALGRAPGLGEPAVVREQTTGALAQVPGSNPSVAFYWFGATAGVE